MTSLQPSFSTCIGWVQTERGFVRGERDEEGNWIITGTEVLQGQPLSTGEPFVDWSIENSNYTEHVPISEVSDGYRDYAERPTRLFVSSRALGTQAEGTADTPWHTAD